MDNNILASDFGFDQLLELTDTDCRLDINQGLDARLVDDNAACVLSRLSWIKYIRFSCDSAEQIAAIEQAARLLSQNGVGTWRMFIYMLVTSDIEEAVERVERLKQIPHITLYAQAERNEAKGIRPNALQQEFALRYIYSGLYRSETWTEYLSRHSRIGKMVSCLT